MKFDQKFINYIKKFNGETVELKVIHLAAHNHPLGEAGMGSLHHEHPVLVSRAMKDFNGSDGVIEIHADMEFVVNQTGERLFFVNNDFECNCIEIYKPETDDWLWWSYHPMSHHDLNQLMIISHKAKIGDSKAEGNTYPIHDIIINGISHHSPWE